MKMYDQCNKYVVRYENIFKLSLYKTDLFLANCIQLETVFTGVQKQVCLALILLKLIPNNTFNDLNFHWLYWI